jgi:enoyl-CoA hydratase
MPCVTWTVHDGLATIRLGREHGNAIDASLTEDLLRCVLETAQDPSVRGAILASRGKIFCPGLDLQDLLDLDRPTVAAFMTRFRKCLLALYTYPKPLVAALGGHALAGGCILALTADWRVLRRGALVGLNEIRVGLPLPYGVAQVLRASVHPNRLEEVALLGRNYTDDEAVATGLVHEVCDGAGFDEHCAARLEGFASKDPTAFARTKTYLRAATVERIVRGDAERLDEFLDCWFSETTRRRVTELVAELRRRGK